jgi:transketolase
LLLSRQNLPYASKINIDDLAKGGYVLRESNILQNTPDLTQPMHALIIATGSEVSLALEAQVILAIDNICVRVVSMPSTTVFDRQSPEYKLSVLPANVPTIAVEMGVTDGWWKYGCKAVVGIDVYGESAPAPVLFKHFGFTADNVANTVRRVLGLGL